MLYVILVNSLIVSHMQAMHFVLFTPILLCTSFRNPLSTLMPFLSGPSLFTLTIRWYNLCCSYTHACRTTYWSVFHLLGTTPLKKTDVPSPSASIDCWWLLNKRWALVNPSHLEAEHWLLILCKQPQPCEFMGAAVLLCPEDDLSYKPFWPPSTTEPEPLERRYDVDVLFVAEHGVS